MYICIMLIRIKALKRDFKLYHYFLLFVCIDRYCSKLKLALIVSVIVYNFIDTVSAIYLPLEQ